MTLNGGESWDFLPKTRLQRETPNRYNLETQLWRVAGRESGYPKLLESPRTSPEVPQTSPEVFRRLPRKFSHCGTLQQSRGSPEVSQTSPEVPRTSPEVSRTSRRSALSLASLTPSPDSQKLDLGIMQGCYGTLSSELCFNLQSARQLLHN